MRKYRYPKYFKKSRPEVDTEVYQNWRKSVLRRDKCKCVVCGKRGFIVHHLDGWSWCISRRYDIDNGVVVCSKHHNQFHKIYSRKHNTQQQFILFLNRYYKKTLDI